MRRNLWFLTLSFGLVFCADKKKSGLMEIPESLPDFQVLVEGRDLFNGFIFLRKTAEPGAQMMINANAEIVWYQLSDTVLFRPFTPYENSYLALYSDTEIHEISYEGDTLLKLRMGTGGFDRKLHHEIIRDRDGNLVSLTREFIPVDLSEVGGDRLDTLKTDGILRLSPGGDKLWHWKPTDVLDPLTYPEIGRRKGDWGHANAIFEDTDGNYLVSWRDFNEVWKIDSRSGEVKWRYGGENISDQNQRFYQQHGIHRNLEDEMMLFDNGNARIRQTSRAISFNDNLETTLIIELPDSLFTFKQGSVYQIQRDRFLFSSTMTGTLIITDRQGVIHWMAKGDQGGFYRAYYLERSILD